MVTLVWKNLSSHPCQTWLALLSKGLHLDTCRILYKSAFPYFQNIIQKWISILADYYAKVDFSTFRILCKSGCAWSWSPFVMDNEHFMEVNFLHKYGKSDKCTTKINFSLSRNSFLPVWRPFYPGWFIHEPDVEDVDQGYFHARTPSYPLRPRCENFSCPLGSYWK